MSFERKLGVMLSKPVAYLFFLIYLIQSSVLIYFVYQYYDNQQTIFYQQKHITELEEKLKVLDIIEDFQGAGTQGGDVIQLVGFGEDVTLVAGGDQMGNRVYFLMGPAEEDFRGAFYAAPGLVPGEDIVFVA